MFENTPFFRTDELDASQRHGCVVGVPTGIIERKELFEVFQNGLALPKYFGKNWDALDECLRDLNWIKEKRIVIIHNDVPLINDPVQSDIYIEVLKNAALHWADKEAHEFLVIFPV